MQNQGMNIQIKLYAYLNKYDTRLTEEKIAIEKAIRELHFSSEHVNNKKNNTEVTFIFIIYR
ncbi:hypothetical protein [Escherichia coli]|uniref:hypothetical protein n=1 Tax=Escherichia coli TaxID=562 RepID=UPI00203CE0A3|nr:hypothetical protein [Escherichia coli]